MEFTISHFSFPLPRDLIARFPTERRGDSRLMVVDRKAEAVTHSHFSELLSWIEPEDFLVMNDTRVDPARLIGSIAGKFVEMLVIKWLGNDLAEILSMPAVRFRKGAIVEFEGGLTATVEELGIRGRRILRFSEPSAVSAAGFAPLPPYIKRKREEAVRYREYDLERYQTVYAAAGGSIAAPTAGLHFSDSILTELRKRHEICFLTLNVGPATFQKIETEDIRNHRMGMEKVSFPLSQQHRILTLREDGKKLLAVGTTSARSLEAAVRFDPPREKFETDLFIFPGFEFRTVDRLLTNFHLPESSLFLLVCAFAGTELMQAAYRIAIERRYRFFSYGDAMLIL